MYALKGARHNFYAGHTWDISCPTWCRSFFEVKLNEIFHFHRCYWRRCSSCNHWMFLIMRNSLECTLTDWTSFRKVSTSRWQYDTWIYNFPNQDSSIITKNKHPDYFNWQLEINNICCSSMQSGIFNHYYYHYTITDQTCIFKCNV